MTTKQNKQSSFNKKELLKIIEGIDADRHQNLINNPPEKKEIERISQPYMPSIGSKFNK